MEMLVVGAGAVLMSLFFGMYADDEEPPDKSSYHWAFIQRHRLPGKAARYIGLPIGVLLIFGGLIDLVI